MIKKIKVAVTLLTLVFTVGAGRVMADPAEPRFEMPPPVTEVMEPVENSEIMEIMPISEEITELPHQSAESHYFNFYEQSNFPETPAGLALLGLSLLAIIIAGVRIFYIVRSSKK